MSTEPSTPRKISPDDADQLISFFSDFLVSRNLGLQTALSSIHEFGFGNFLSQYPILKSQPDFDSLRKLKERNIDVLTPRQASVEKSVLALFKVKEFEKSSPQNGLVSRITAKVCSGDQEAEEWFFKSHLELGAIFALKENGFKLSKAHTKTLRAYQSVINKAHIKKIAQVGLSRIFLLIPILIGIVFAVVPNVPLTFMDVPYYSPLGQSIWIDINHNGYLVFLWSAFLYYTLLLSKGLLTDAFIVRYLGTKFVFVSSIITNTLVKLIAMMMIVLSLLPASMLYSPDSIGYHLKNGDTGKALIALKAAEMPEALHNYAYMQILMQGKGTIDQEKFKKELSLVGQPFLKDAMENKSQRWVNPNVILKLKYELEPTKQNHFELKKRFYALALVLILLLMGISSNTLLLFKINKFQKDRDYKGLKRFLY